MSLDLCAIGSRSSQKYEKKGMTLNMKDRHFLWYRLILIPTYETELVKEEVALF